jgi:uncharacterized protein YecE (DUF72 family)
MVDYYIGTMGFSYRDWAGSFYPTGAPARDYLVHYARIFNAVEIDSTFYGIPKPGSVIRWRDQSPEDFKICLKVPRSITHDAGLVNTQHDMDKFIETISPLGKKLGVILIQFPPSFDISKKEAFEAFLEKLPPDQMFAVEFRHPSWYVPPTKSLLAKKAVCWAATEYPGVPQEVPLTSDIIFIRLVGQHGRFREHDREQIDVSQQLHSWWDWIKLNSDQVHTVFVFFNDDYSGHAPASANRLKDIIGLEVIKPDIPKQMRFL